MGHVRNETVEFVIEGEGNTVGGGEVITAYYGTQAS